MSQLVQKFLPATRTHELVVVAHYFPSQLTHVRLFEGTFPECLQERERLLRERDEVRAAGKSSR